MQSDHVKKNIMRRVYTVYLMKSVAQPLLLELLIIAAIVAMAGLFVSIKHIFENVVALHDMQAIGSFIVSAFIHTDTVVKLIIVGAFTAAMLFMWDSFRRIRRALEYRT
jgi:hypothetical protein